MTFPVRSFGFYWLGQVFQEQRVGNFVEPFGRSLVLGAVVMFLTASLAVLAAMGFRQKLKGSADCLFDYDWHLQPL